MNKILILYKSKYGATEKYARMLAEKLGAVLLENKKLRPEQLKPYNAIIYCGGIYAGGVAGIAFLRKNAALLNGKKAAVLAVGASPYDEKAIARVRVQNLAGLPKGTALFYGRGAWDESAMMAGDRLLCGMLKKMVAKKDPASMEPWEQALMEAMGKKCSWVDEKYLLPLIAYITA